MDEFLFPILRYAHILGAIITFGPSFVYILLSRQSRAMPQGGYFAAVLGRSIQRRIIIPGAIIQGLTGAGMVWILAARGVDLTSSAYHWLWPAIVLYLVMVAFAIFIQAPNIERLVGITKAMSTPGAVAPGGPPVELLALSARLARGGSFLSLLLVVVVFLMAIKPTIG